MNKNDQKEKVLKELQKLIDYIPRKNDKIIENLKKIILEIKKNI